MAERTGELVEEKFRVGEAELRVLKAGTGKPLVIFHGELGFPGWRQWLASMAKKHTLWIPLHPGFGRSPQAAWVMGVRDLASFYARFIREQGLTPVDVIGLSFGGWVAAEMAVNDARQFNKMVLVAPTGLRPPSGEIMDMFTVTARAYLQRNVLDPKGTPEFGSMFGGEQSPEQFEAWEEARAEAARIAWKPYMFNQSMAQLLEGISGLPTLLLWGRQDPVVPLSAGELYQKKIAGSKLVTFDRCGHMPAIERRDEFVRELDNFLG
ncbi:MAG: alpha/beta fold hydrolase [Candidatus Binataceae bacterium]